MPEILRHHEEEQKGDRPPLSREVGERKQPPTTMFNKFVRYFKDAFSTGRAEVIEKVREEVEIFEKQREKEGVNFSRCQLDKVVADYKEGKKVEVDCFSPYLSDYNLATGEVWRDKLVLADKIGLSLLSDIKARFPKIRPVVLYDEYNTSMPDTAEEVTGKPLEKGTQIVLNDSVKQSFKSEVKDILVERDIIKKEAEEGKDVVIISESEKIKDAQELVKKLDALGKLTRIENKENPGHERIIFRNEDANDPAYREIELCDSEGHWSCPALDSASFLKPENLDITHLVMLPLSFKKQQDQVWEILNVLGVKPEHYHNIFYDQFLIPKEIREKLGDKLGKFEEEAQLQWKRKLEESDEKTKIKKKIDKGEKLDERDQTKWENFLEWKKILVFRKVQKECPDLEEVSRQEVVSIITSEIDKFNK